MKTKYRVYPIIALVVCFFALAGAGRAQAVDHNRVVNFAYQAITDSFDLAKINGVAEAISMAQVYDTLLRKAQDGKFLPNLAESWEITPDGIEYTFRLRKDVKWQDGVDFTAADVEFTFQHLIEAPAYVWLYKNNIDRMEVPDPHTFKVFLKKPNAFFISALATPSNALIMPKHGFEKYGSDYGLSVDKIIGTGAYVVTDWKPDVSITYKAKEDYFNGAPQIKNAVFHQITDSNAAIVAMQTGEMDIYLAPVSGSAYKTLSGKSNIVLGEYITARNEAIYMYCKEGMFTDVRLRKAVAYAIDKEDALTVGMDGLGKIIHYPGDIGPAMTANPDFTPETTYTQDLDKARALVEEAGYEGASVVVKSYNTDPYAVLAVYLQGVLNEIGLKATVEPMERATFLAQRNAGSALIFPLGWVGSAYDMDEILGGCLYSANQGNGGNNSFYADPEMDKLIEASRATADPEARREIYKKIINKFMDEVPFVSLFAMKGAVPRNAELTTEDPKTYRLFDYTWVK
ncbi:MAG: ABC transporter substrate-binding protein [Synergistaceae bacterium]|jgi:peptide/nickel transport system substrate-binding protein|nr:ABC transporter substrate-binding protein [Synergistaceae bacterium]